MQVNELSNQTGVKHPTIVSKNHSIFLNLFHPHNASVDFPLIKDDFISIPKPSLVLVFFFLLTVLTRSQWMKYYLSIWYLLSSFSELNPLYIRALVSTLTSFVVTFPFLWFVLLLHFLLLCFDCNPRIICRNRKRVWNSFYPTARTSSGRARAMVRSSNPLKPRWTRGLHPCWALSACRSRARWGCCKFIHWR